MQWDRIEGHWKQVTGRAKKNWEKLTDTDFIIVAGRRDKLIDKVQERYGVAREEAAKQVAEWQREVRDSWFR